MVTTRRLAREATLQALYSLDTTGEWSEERVKQFAKHFLSTGSPLHTAPETPDDALHREFCRELLEGILLNREGIDKVIEYCATHWDVERMNQVDRNILRLGVYEILFRDDIPEKVSINEAIEITKSYGSEDSPNFINGVLDKVTKVLRGEKDFPARFFPEKSVANE